MMWWKKKSLYLLAISLVLATIIWIQMGMFLSHLLFGTDVKMNVLKFCLRLFVENSIYYFLVIFFINTVLAYILLITLIKISKQWFLSKRFYRKVLGSNDGKLSQLFNDQYGTMKNMMVVKSSQPLAFTMGFFKPTIVLSTGLIELLEEDELKAVIEHETYHKNTKDPCKILILDVIAHSLWFIPLTKWCYQNYVIISEILADEYAIKRMGSEVELSSALLKLIKHHMVFQSSPSLAYFSGGSINYRLQQLVQPHEAIPVKLTSCNIFISVSVVLFFIGMVFLTMA